MFDLVSIVFPYTSEQNTYKSKQNDNNLIILIKLFIAIHV